MEKTNKTLLLFTGEFPYGKKGEPFLEIEMPYLAKCFEKIYVFPQKKSDFLRDLPKNVSVIDVLIGNHKRIRNNNIWSILSAFIFICGEALRTKNGYKYFFNLKHYLYIFINAKLNYANLLDWFKLNKISNALAYTYWSDSSLLACSFLKRQHSDLKIITRAHGFDLYDSRDRGGLTAFRISKYKATDKIYCISKHGKNYLEHQLPQSFHSKLVLSYLGVKRPSSHDNILQTEMPILVSCARMEPFKRISMIPDVLKHISTPVKWVHFGDGPEFEIVQEKIMDLPKYIDIKLMGQCTNIQVHDFYQNNKVSALISLSTSEGLPVSMMEAISYGVPIIAVAINGVPEIVNNITGILLEPDASAVEIAERITEAIQTNRYKEEEIKAFYESNFNSDINYDKFAKEISNLI